MRDQYAGDISDVLKFGLLRALAGHDRNLGIAWYYAPGHDGRADGRHQEWRNEEAWHRLDQCVASALSSLPERSVEALESAQLWPAGSFFHREPMPHSTGRQEWAMRKRDALSECDLVFLDPDNGLGSDPEKHATFTEVRDLRRIGRAIVFISFPKRVKHDLQLRELHEKLRNETGAQDVFTIRTSVSVRSGSTGNFVPRARWFTVVDADSVLLNRAQSFAIALSSIPRAKATIE
jgi:hypothetical protein